ncbi:DsbA family protein [Marinibacterium profundimaris]|uniref:Thiol-disulfide oxidoreductase n=1 Tax=Marinibacterium profundimaris TaxID=1679460 RepID=A0A225NN55_9RHOB|nr:DsbA family protein [Marinibacterium profundimaris]OWU73609.1 thiol-disulfide oxidoreductase [Marinibacterium profundimaris]
MTRTFLPAGAAALLLAGAYAFLSQPAPTAPGQAQLLPGAAMAQDADAAEAEVDTSTIVEMTMGAEDAPITMIEYASYTCPHCAAFHAGPFKQIKENYIDTGKVRFIYREVYFDRYGLWASMIARCAGEDRFFGMNDLIYSSQDEWTRAGDPQAIVAELKKMGKMAGLDDAALDACLQDGEKARTLVAWFQENAEADDVTGTPSFVIDGEKVSNQPYADFAALFDEKLGE